MQSHIYCQSNNNKIGGGNLLRQFFPKFLIDLF